MARHRRVVYKSDAQMQGQLDRIKKNYDSNPTQANLDRWKSAHAAYTRYYGNIRNYFIKQTGHYNGNQSLGFVSQDVYMGRKAMAAVNG